ncbi:MAG: hypothetical protein ACJAV5_001940 [Vicingaceae bacterium]|jgi:hypothetical protein
MEVRLNQHTNSQICHVREGVLINSKILGDLLQRIKRKGKKRDAPHPYPMHSFNLQVKIRSENSSFSIYNP